MTIGLEPLPQLKTRDLTEEIFKFLKVNKIYIGTNVVDKITLHRVVLGSASFRYYNVRIPTLQVIKLINFVKSKELPLTFGCDANIANIVCRNKYLFLECVPTRLSGD